MKRNDNTLQGFFQEYDNNVGIFFFKQGNKKLNLYRGKRSLDIDYKSIKGI